MKHKIIFIVVLIFASHFAKTQNLLPLVELEKQKKYTLDEAFASPNPELVYYIDNSGISSKNIPAEIKKFTNLQKIVLWKNDLTDLPLEFYGLTNLQSISLRENYLSDSNLLIKLTALKNIKNLDLSLNKFKVVPDGFYNFSVIRSLSLAFNDIETISDKIGNLSTLNEIYLNNNSITSLPENFGQLSNLYEVDLQHNNLEVLPESLENLTKLEVLNAKENPITKMPKNISKWTNLEELYFSKHNLSAEETTRIKGIFKDIELSFDEN
jgi:Leucine-rich repeat (LRR) protein